MTFNSWEFLIFYPIVALLYYLLPKKLVWPMLLISSYYFYMFYQPDLIYLIFGTTLISWIASHIITKSEKKSIRKLWLALTLIVCLGVLFFYKYFNFLAGSVVSLAEMFGAAPSPVALNLILPVGISFYTFQTLSYVIDVYRGNVQPEKNFFFYALFVSFFPQLVAGPIERPDNLIPQLRERHPWRSENAVKGAKHMLVGFFKKIVVADGISIYVDAVYNNTENASTFAVILATMLFAVQIYCDFSGYTDIAIGCARIMGIRLMQNFNHPYMATSIKEFWSRWHISLSSWFKDYLYFPLGGSRCALPRALMNLMIVFLVSGLWHGAAWTYVIWGGIHGVYQIVGRLTAKKRSAFLSKRGLSENMPLIAWIRRVNVFLLVCFAWMFFRANSTADAFYLVGKLFTGWNVGIGDALSDMGLTPIAILTVIASIFTLIIIDHLLTYDDAPDGSHALVQNGAFIYYVWMILFFWGLLLSKNLTSTFIYFQF